MLILNSILKRILLSIVFISVVSTTKGYEHIVFEPILTNTGLSNGTINSTFRDSRGFMWFCTEDGLCRYDGYTINNYPFETAYIHSIQNIQVFAMAEDCYNHIWIATSEGLFFYDQKSDKVESFSKTFNYSSVANISLNETVNCLLFDSFHYLWVGTYNGVLRVKLKQHDLQTIENKDISFFSTTPDDSLRLSNKSIFSIYEDTIHQIWFSSNSNQLDCYNYDEQKITHKKIKIADSDKWGYLIKKIRADRNDNFWIATMGQGLIHWQRDTHRFSQIKFLKTNNDSIDIRFIRSLLIDSRNRIWIGTDGNGLILFDQETNEITHLKKDKEDQSKLSSNAIYSIYEDNNGIYWIGTYLMGLNKFVSNKTSFSAIYSSPYSETGLSHHIVTSFCEDKNHKIWVSTDGGGLNQFDPTTYRFKQYKHNPDKSTSLSTNTTISLFCDSTNAIWVATYNGGLNRLNQKTQQFDHFWQKTGDSTSINSNSPWGFAHDKWNNLWVSTVDAGLNLLKPGSTTFIRYIDVDKNYFGSDEIIDNSITHLFIDSKNFLWIGTEYGLDRVNLNQVDFSLPKPALYFDHFFPNDTLNSISHFRISYINQDSLNNLWIGTKGGGLNKLNLETNIFTCYTVNDGLPNNIINGILFDDDNNPWISTNNGLSFLNIKTNKFLNYNISDGLQSNVFFKTACFKSSDGMFYFGGINGFNIFHPKNITPSRSKLKPAITDFYIFNNKIEIGQKRKNRVILNQSLYDLDIIHLLYNENSISFEFTALDYSKPEKIYYSYKLLGFDEVWQFTDAKMRIAKYTNLAPGEYTFSVKASNNKGDWSNPETSIQIIIRPPWWKTILFKIIAVIVLISLWVAGFSLRVYALEKQKQKLQTKVEKRTQQLSSANQKLQESNFMKDKFLSILAHDLINPFNAILGFSDLLASNYHKWNDQKRITMIKAIHESSNNLFDLLRNLLQWSRAERGLLEYSPEDIDLHECIETNISVQTITANSKNISIITDFSNEQCLVYSDLQLLNTIIRNLVSNAIKFTLRGGTITVKTRKINQFIELSVIDSGVGMEQTTIDNLFKIGVHQSTPGTNNEKGTGLGLILVKEFVTKQKGTLSIKSVVNKGSTFSFTIPCSNNKNEIE